MEWKLRDRITLMYPIVQQWVESNVYAIGFGFSNEEIVKTIGQ